jgi:4-amino-4-deoxy-L-arabinose transferase-like glycosyltransferase
VFPNEGGRPFLLHPPLSLLINGLAVHLFHISGSPIDVVLSLRWVNALIGAITVALVFALVRTVVGQAPALAAAAVVAFDPFVLRNNGRVLIDTPAVLFLVAAWLVLLRTAKSRSRWVSIPGELLAGLLLGAALVTKDMTVVPGALAALLALAWRRTLRLGTALRLVVVSLLPYAAYLGYLRAHRMLPLWLDDKSSGVLRMIGVQQETGFNSVPVSLSQRVVEEIPRFGTSYALLALAVVAGVIAALSPVAAQRLVGIVATCAGLMGAYALIAGAAEEQFGYYVVVLAVPAFAVAVPMVARRLRLPGHAVASLVGLFVGATCIFGMESRFVVDDGFARAAAWMEDGLPPGADVAVTGPTAQYAFPGYDVSDSLAALEEHDNDYALTSSAPLLQGYGYASPQLLEWLRENARPVFEFSGPSNGNTVVWRIDRRAVDLDVRRGVRIPPVTTADR